MTEYKAVESKVKSLITSIKLDKGLNRQHGKILYVRGIERKENTYHVHCTFVFEKSKPTIDSFKKKLKALWTFGDICVKAVWNKQGLALYFTKMKNKLIDYKTGEIYVPYYPSGAHIIEKSRGLKFLDYKIDYEPAEQIKDDYNCYKKQHKFKGKTCIDTIYFIPKKPNKKK